MISKEMIFGIVADHVSKNCQKCMPVVCKNNNNSVADKNINLKNPAMKCVPEIWHLINVPYLFWREKYAAYEKYNF